VRCWQAEQTGRQGTLQKERLPPLPSGEIREPAVAAVPWVKRSIDALEARIAIVNHAADCRLLLANVAKPGF